MSNNTMPVLKERSFYGFVIKRILDIILSFLAIVVLSPIYLLLIVLGAINMKGNPFFVQPRPGRKNREGNERIFKMVKFRSMTNEKGADGKLLPDTMRLKKYGKMLRSTSLDELPELFNILIGDMSIVGPRPLMERYLKFYTTDERRRHNVRPGLTGYAQVHGRNTVSWEERIAQDLYYVEHISFLLDLRILLRTVMLVIKREGTSNENMENFDDYRKRQWKESKGVLDGEKNRYE